MDADYRDDDCTGGGADRHNFIDKLIDSTVFLAFYTGSSLKVDVDMSRPKQKANVYITKRWVAPFISNGRLAHHHLCLKYSEANRPNVHGAPHVVRAENGYGCMHTHLSM